MGHAIRQCGKVTVTHFPSSVATLAQRKVVFTETKRNEILSTTADRDGYFCKMLPHGTFLVEPQILSNEKAAGFVLKPSSIKVTVADRALEDITFRQLEARISGRLLCIEQCSDVHVSLFQDGVKINRVLAEPSVAPAYEFQNIFPGMYTVITDEDRLCWEKTSIDVTVKDEDVNSVDFSQSGFTLTVMSSHAVSLSYRHSVREMFSGTFSIPKGRETFCLPIRGVYDLNVSSCHIFREPTFSYDTDTGELVILQAIKHGVQFDVKLEGKNNVFEVVISSAKHVAPVILHQEDAINMTIDGTYALYTFLHYSAPNDDLNILVKSSELVITPVSMKINVKDDCQILNETFYGTSGVFLEGYVSPPHPGVFITIRGGKNSPLMATVTDVKGRYSLGPFRCMNSFDVEASLEGYWFEPIAGEFGSFIAHKLSELIVQVADSDGNPLSSVLVVISDRSELRMRNLTDEDGRIISKGIGSGEYFVHAFMKEYSFQPASQPIRVDEGSRATVKLTGMRVAFSCFGQVKYLAGVPVFGIVVEAVSNNCDQHQEEATSDQSGIYTLRGLQSYCEYTVRLKLSHIGQNVWPREYKFTVTQNDSIGFDFTLSPINDKMDVIGYVHSDPDYFPTLMIHIQRLGHSDFYSERVKIDNSSMFIFPAVPADGSVYAVRLSSSIKISGFEPFCFPEVILVVIFMLLEPFQKKQHGYGSTRGSYLAFPIGFLVAVVAYNFTMVLWHVLYESYGTTTTSQITTSSSSSTSSGLEMIHY
ncbi:hypothetical protein TTRE_0000725901 [Trichuris trichiura]|uniref:Nodal modulator 1 n=1 Tax=Trichuris trichiura TaxID=36087 RepID=A0A077ZJY2_TRITR|nr:hypothetical protein TTRE_0000725901 [Trichuris trichiura]